MRYITAVLALVALPAFAQPTVTSTRIESVEWTCRSATGAVLSSHTRQDKAEEACINRALAAPGTNFEVRPSGYRWVAQVPAPAPTPTPEPTPEPVPPGDGGGDGEPVPPGDGGGDGEPVPPGDGGGDGSGEPIPPPGSGDGDGGGGGEPSPVPSPSPVAGVEARCNELGANCFCSEPLNTTSYARGGTNSEYFNPADSTSAKQCSFELTNFPIFIRSGAGGPSTDTTARSRLPAGHSVSAFFASSPSGNGTFWVGTDRNMPSSWQRFAMRWYMYYSPDYNFGDGSKLLQINNGLGQTMPVGQPGNTHQYGFNGHTFSGGVMGDCCSAGPPTGVDPGAAGLVGKWWRFEYVVSNPTGPGVRYQLYAKDVTNNAAEFLLIDSGVPCSACRPNPAGLGATDLRPSARISRILGNFYRQGTGQRGFRGVSHLMYAGWDTNSGQRIGAASEVE